MKIPNNKTMFYGLCILFVYCLHTVVHGESVTLNTSGAQFCEALFSRFLNTPRVIFQLYVSAYVNFFVLLGVAAIYLLQK